MWDETEEEVEAEKLAQGVLQITRSTETLISLVAKLINQYGSKDLEIRAGLQKAHNQYAKGRELLEEIGFFEKVQ